jgi:hypothetical protein
LLTARFAITGKLDLDDNAISGTIPPQIANIGSLTELLMHTNQLVGTIPSRFGEMANLGELFPLRRYLTFDFYFGI